MPLNSIPPTTTLAGAGGQAGRRARPGPRRRRVLGRRRARQRRRPGAAARRPGSSGSSASCCPRGVDEFPHLDAAGLARRDGGDRAARRAADRARRGRTDAIEPRRPRPRRTPASSPPGRPRAEQRGDRAADRRRARAPAAGCTSSTSRPPTRCRRSATPARGGVALTVETCPHYLTLTAEEVPDGATEFKCCPPIRDAANRDLLWEGLADGDHRPGGHRPLAVHAPSSSASTPATSARPGAASPPSSSGLPGGVDRGPRAAATTWPTWSAGCAEAPGRPGRAAAQGPDRDRRTTPTSASSRPTRRSWSTPPALHHKNPVTPYAGRTLTGTVRQTWLRGVAGRPGRPTRGDGC